MRLIFVRDSIPLTMIEDPSRHRMILSLALCMGKTHANRSNFDLQVLKENDQFLSNLYLVFLQVQTAGTSSFLQHYLSNLISTLNEILILFF